MPGTGYAIDKTVLDLLPVEIRSYAIQLLGYCSLDQLIQLKKVTCVQLHMTEEVTMTQQLWQKTLRSVILAKITYFDVRLITRLSYFEMLFELVASAFDSEDKSPSVLAKLAGSDHPTLAQWLVDANERYKKLKELIEKRNAVPTSSA